MRKEEAIGKEEKFVLHGVAHIATQGIANTITQNHDNAGKKRGTWNDNCYYCWAIPQLFDRTAVKLIWYEGALSGALEGLY